MGGPAQHTGCRVGGPPAEGLCPPPVRGSASGNWLHEAGDPDKAGSGFAHPPDHLDSLQFNYVNRALPCGRLILLACGSDAPVPPPPRDSAPALLLRARPPPGLCHPKMLSAELWLPHPSPALDPQGPLWGLGHAGAALSGARLRSRDVRLPVSGPTPARPPWEPSSLVFRRLPEWGHCPPQAFKHDPDRVLLVRGDPGRGAALHRGSILPIAKPTPLRGLCSWARPRHCPPRSFWP